MLKGQELVLPCSCLNKAKATEPIFVLRGKDPVAAQAVRHWADMAEARGLHADKIEEARKFADEMDAYCGLVARVPEESR